MAGEANKAVVLRFINEVRIGKDLSVVDELYSPELANHTASGNQDFFVQGMKDALDGFFRSEHLLSRWEMLRP